jgi:hypothetical protein
LVIQAQVELEALVAGVTEKHTVAAVVEALALQILEVVAAAVILVL